MSFIKTIVQFTQNHFNKGHERSIEAKKNIIASFGLKGISIVVSFLLVPLTLNYLDKNQIWPMAYNKRDSELVLLF